MSFLSHISPIRFIDAPSVSMILPGEVSLWSCGALSEYTADCIAFRSAHLRILIDGERLVLKAMSQNEVLIRGVIRGVRCEPVDG